MSEKTTRCADCRCEFTDEELVGATACPKCGTASTPMDMSDDIELHINVHELRILTIWASNWAEQHCKPASQRTLSSIINALRPQVQSGTPLTMGDEFQGVADTLGTDVEVHGADGKQVIKPETRH